MTSRAIWIALFASLAINVFALGAFIGVRLTEARIATPEAPPARVRNPLMEAVRALPPEAQVAWRAHNRDFMRAAGPELRESRRLTREALRGLGAEPFDAAVALAALERARDAERQGRGAMDRRLVEFAAGLPPEDRRAFAEALRGARIAAAGRAAGLNDRGRRALFAEVDPSSDQKNAAKSKSRALGGGRLALSDRD